MGPRPVLRCLAPLVVMLFFHGDVVEGGSWCVASTGATNTALQQGLDYACGLGGASCTPILPGGICFEPNTLHDHASYAYNSYYQMEPAGSTCDFNGSAMLTSTDPSTGTCKYPSVRS